jgi:hypothetical protein
MIDASESGIGKLEYVRGPFLLRKNLSGPLLLCPVVTKLSVEQTMGV